MPRFSLDYSYAGHAGTIDDVDARWSEQGYALVGRGVGAIRRVTITTELPFDVAALATRWGLGSGQARLTSGGRTLIAGRMQIAHGLPSRTGTPVEVELADDARDEAGTWPVPESSVIVPRAPDDVVGGSWQVLYQDVYRPRKGTLTWVDMTRAESEAYSNIPAVTQGQSFPRVFGAPGSATVPGTPAWYVDEGTFNDKLVIAGHAVGAATVTVWGRDDTDPDTLVAVPDVPVHVGVIEALGIVYSFISTADVNNPGVVTLPVDKEHFVSWTGGDALPGGAGTVLLDVLASSSLRVDFAAWERVRSILDRYVLAGFAEDPTPSLDYITGALLPLLPVTIVTGPNGLRPMLAPWLDPEPPATWLRVSAGPGLTFGGRVEERAVGAVAAVTLEYGRRPDTGKFDDVATAEDPDAAGAAEGLQTAVVWSPATAEAIAADMLRLRAGRPRTVRYDVTDIGLHGPGGDRELYIGRTLRFTDDDLGWSDLPAVVSETEIGPDSMTVTIDLRDDGVRGDRRVA